MKDIIALYAIRYGLEDTLTDIADGLVQATEGISGLTQDGKKDSISMQLQRYTTSETNLELVHSSELKGK